MFYDLFRLVNYFSPSYSMRFENMLPKSFKSNAATQKPSVVYFWGFPSMFTLQKTLPSSSKAPDSKWLHPSSPTCTQCVSKTPQHTFTLVSSCVGKQRCNSFKYFIISGMNLLNVIYGRSVL